MTLHPENFNKYFVNSIIRINNDIKEINDDIKPLLEQNLENFKFKEVEIDQVMRMTKKITKKTNKSEILNAMVWYNSVEYTGFFITKLVNESLMDGYVPDQWKIATIHPIPKIKNTIKADEYRPINTMPVDGKILESIVKEQLMEFIESNNLLHKNQSAFRKIHSCETTINLLIQDLNESYDKDEHAIVVFIDLKRAFETIDRELLKKKLKTYGIKNRELKWFMSYLSNRKQRTKFRDEISDQIDVPIGVPQGTQLSVILFILYINDITQIPKHSKTILFADDTAMKISCKPIDQAMEQMNSDLNEISNWLNRNKLKLNINKTKWMLLSKENSNPEMSRI